MVTLVLNEERPHVLTMLTDTFRNEREVEIFTGKPFLFYTQRALDAYITITYEAHELYGIGENLHFKTVPTNSEKSKTTLAREVVVAPTYSAKQLPAGFPSFVVVAPAFPGHAIFPSPTTFGIVSNDQSLSAEEMTYVHMSLTFEAVKDFNQITPQRIHRLGLILDNLGIPGAPTDEEQRREIEAIRTCFHDFLQ